MNFRVDPEYDSLTAPAVRLELDADTCFLLSTIFTELGNALYRSQARYKARRRFQENAPVRDGWNAIRANVARRIADLDGLPGRKAVSSIAKEFDITWDEADFLCAQARREKRQAALAGRNAEIERLKKEGFTAGLIASKLKLSEGSVRNILTRLRKAVGRRANAKAQAA